MSEYDTTALLEEVRERASLPDSDARLTATSILAAATKELREGVAPLLCETRAEHLVYAYEVSVVSGTAVYRMPPRAIGGSLRDVVWVDASALAQPPMRQLSSDDPEALRSGQGTPSAYFVRNYSVVLVPTPNVSGTLRMPYYARPNRLVETSSVGVLTGSSLGASSSTLTCTAQSSSAKTALLAASKVDVVRATPGFETLGSSLTVSSATNPSGNTVLLTVAGTTVDSSLTAGDYVCLEGEAPVPQVPLECHGLLAVRTARRLLKAVGDNSGWQELNADVEELEGRVRSVLSPRVAGDTQQPGGSIGSNGLVAGLWF